MFEFLRIFFLVFNKYFFVAYIVWKPPSQLLDFDKTKHMAKISSNAKFEEISEISVQFNKYHKIREHKKKR